MRAEFWGFEAASPRGYATEMEIPDTEYEEGNRLMKALETKLDRDDHAKGQMNFHKQMHEGLRARGMEADLPPEEEDAAEEEDDEDEDDMEYYVDKDEV